MSRKQNEHYTTLICGATFSGVGALLASPDNALVIERTGMVGGEYIEAIHPGRHGQLPVASSFGSSFNEELVARNLIAEDGGPVHLPALHPLLCRKLIEAKAAVLMLTEIIAVRPHARGYEATICNSAGWQVITASKIIDTTTRLATRPGQSLRSEARSLNAYIVADNKELPLPVWDHPRVELVQGRFASEHILKWRIAPGEDWSAARNGLVQWWISRPAALQPWTIAALATEMEYGAPDGAQRLDTHWSWFPSIGHDHPLLALERGFIQAHRNAEEENDDDGEL